MIFSKRRAKKIFCAKEALRYVLLHLFSKRCSKKRVWAFEKTTENVSAPFFEKVQPKRFFANVAIRNLFAPFSEKARPKT